MAFSQRSKTYLKTILWFSIFLGGFTLLLDLVSELFDTGKPFSDEIGFWYMIEFYLIGFCNAACIFLALRRIIRKTQEAHLLKLIGCALAIIFIVYNILYLWDVIDYYYIEGYTDTVSKDSLEVLLDFMSSTRNKPRYDLYNHFIYFPYWTLMFAIESLNVVDLLFFLLTDRIVMPVLVSIGLYFYYRKRVKNQSGKEKSKFTSC